MAVPEEIPYVTDILNLPEGECVLKTPARMSPESAAEFGDWLEIILRIVQRSAGQDSRSIHYHPEKEKNPCQNFTR